MNTPAEIIKACASDKLQLNRSSEDLSLVEVRSNGERSIYKDNDISVPTALSLNGRIFVSPKDHLDALVSDNFKINFQYKYFRYCYNLSILFTSFQNFTTWLVIQRNSKDFG